ncbi:MAG: hypothetical protein LKE99_11475 [Lachnospiraceae bacterium]|jgi:hypothetical protein|nr:hypothetical protein [Lachnospiraceae bacterium]MCH4103995.1 hypothetical protein [Lachnospiraceae bacterium]
MSSVYRNNEGYVDTTAGMAIAHAAVAEKKKKYRPIVYICSKYRGDTEKNAADALKYCRFAVRRGCIPIAPHIFFAHSGILNDADPEERKLGMFIGIILLDRCEEVWIFGNELSDGMKREYDRAVRRNIKIRTFTDSCVEIGG